MKTTFTITTTTEAQKATKLILKNINLIARIIFSETARGNTRVRFTNLTGDYEITYDLHDHNWFTVMEKIINLDWEDEEDIEGEMLVFFNPNYKEF